MRTLLLSGLFAISVLAATTADCADLGASVYAQRCAACHGVDGQGTPGVAPALKGEPGRLAAAPSGREYLIQAVMFGLMGPIRSGGQQYQGAMPAIGQQLAPEDAAALLNYVVTGLNAGNQPTWQPISPAEVTQVSAARLSPTALARKRATLGADSRAAE